MQIIQHTDAQLAELGQFDSRMEEAHQQAEAVRLRRYDGSQTPMSTRAERRKTKKRKATAKASRQAQHKGGQR